MMDGLLHLLTMSVPRVTLLVGISWVFTRFLQRAPAASRYWLWIVTLSAALLVPFLIALMPTLSISLPSFDLLSQTFETTDNTPNVPEVLAPYSASDLQRIALWLGEMGSENVSDGHVEQQVIAITGIVWCAGMLVVLIRAARELVRLRRLTRQATPLNDAGWQQMAEDVAIGLGIQTKVHLLISDDVSVPMASSLGVPTILLPRLATHWNMERQRIVLLHETCHLARRDTLVQCLSLFAGVIYWFNPLIWVAIRRLNEECERSCDDFVLKSGIANTRYANHLVDIARNAIAFPVLGVGVVSLAQKSALAKRIAWILESELNRNALPAWSRWALALVVLSLLLTVTGLHFVPVVAQHDRDIASLSGADLSGTVRAGTPVALREPIVSRATEPSFTVRFDDPVSFAPDETGSCGFVENPGGSVTWSLPLTEYAWMRGFSEVHKGVDLAASFGTPVYAANGGSILFAGWNSYGYGYTVVIVNGPFTTLYSHLSAIRVGCGQSVSSGDVIGTVGSSGSASEPHLHFEIRYLDTPVDPTRTLQLEHRINDDP